MLGALLPLRTRDCVCGYYTIYMIELASSLIRAPRSQLSALLDEVEYRPMHLHADTSSERTALLPPQPLTTAR